MPSITQTIAWKSVSPAATLSLAASTDFVNVEEMGGTRDVQVARPLKSAAAKPRNRRNQLGRRVFEVTYPPAATVEAARNAAETLEDNIRNFAAVSSTVEWVFGTKTHTFSDASLEAFSLRLTGLTLRARFVFIYGAKATT